MDLITQNAQNFHTIVLQLLALNHPHINTTNIFTFLWCLWKMRNEKLFNNLESQPSQVIIRTNALINSLQIPKHPKPTPKMNETPSHLLYSGPRIFVDAAWKKRPNGQPSKAGIGIHITWKQGLHITDVLISARTVPVSTPLQAEAEGLLIAASIVSSLILQDPYFFTDNLGLAKAVQTNGGANPNVLWEIRRQAVQFQENMQPLRPSIFHINRSLNAIAHHYAQKAKTLPTASPLCCCTNSTHTAYSCPVSVAINRLTLAGPMIVSAQCL
jgi:hypothetical protein